MGHLTWILGLLGAVALGLVKDEISAWLPRLARWCVCRAANRMPDRARWREEWLAHLDDCPGKLGQLVHAFGVLGISQSRRLRFWLGALRYLPGIRWSVIDGFVTFVGMTSGGLSLYSWYVSGNLTLIFGAISAIFAAISYFTEQYATKLLLRDQEMIKFVIAYQTAKEKQ